MGFQQGLSGLNAAAKNLDAIGNNVANASTVGFKSSLVQFADVYAASLSGGGAGQVGLGTKATNVAQQFTQGNISSSNNPLDVAINGGGFFRLDTNGAISYSRNGQFQLNKDGYIVSSTGAKVTGYGVDVATGAIVATNPSPVSLPTSDLKPQATGGSPSALGAKIGVNLDSREVAPVAAFDPLDPTTFNNSTSMTVYDSLGNPHVLSLYFAKNALAQGTWDLYSDVDGSGVPATIAPSTLVFNQSGELDLPTPLNPLGTQVMPLAVTIDLTFGGTVIPDAAPSLVFDLDFTGSSQYGSAFGVNTLTQDGFSSGRLNGFNVGSDGVIQGRYSNGQSRSLGQLVLANFTNPNGLKPLGNNQWSETPDSNQPLIGTPGSGSLGVMQSGAVEESNVDLTAELVNMITAQRVYQANAQTIKTQDSIMQTIVNLR